MTNVKMDEIDCLFKSAFSYLHWKRVKNVTSCCLEGGLKIKY